MTARWPRKNTAAAIEQRREAMGLDGGLVTSVDLEPFAGAAESLVGVAVIPVSAVPIEVELGEPTSSTTTACRRDRARGRDGARPARPHRGRADRLDDARRARRRHACAPTSSPTASRAPRASSAPTRPAAIALAHWIESELPAMRAWLESSDDPMLSRRARLRGVKTHVVGPMCHVLWQWTTGDAVGPNMMTRNSYALNMGYVMQRAPVKPERAILEANMGGDKKPSAEYFQSGPRQDRARGGAPHRRGDPPRAAHDARRSRGALVGGHARRGRERHAVGRLHARLGDRRGLRRDRPGSRHGRDELDGARHGTPRRRRRAGDDPLRRPRGRHGRRRHDAPLGTRLARLDRVRRPGQGATASRRSSPQPRSASKISASAAMATAGSENFFQAHHERGGLR